MTAIYWMTIVSIISAVDYFVGFWKKIDHASERKRKRRSFVLSRKAKERGLRRMLRGLGECGCFGLGFRCDLAAGEGELDVGREGDGAVAGEEGFEDPLLCDFC